MSSDTWRRLPIALALLGVLVVAVWLVTRFGTVSPPMRLLTVTSLPGAEEDPSLSPDGNFVTFSWTGSDSSGKSDIWVKPVEGDELRRLTDTPDASEHWPAWSPDGRHITFTRIAGRRPADSHGVCARWTGTDDRGAQLPRLVGARRQVARHAGPISRTGARASFTMCWRRAHAECWSSLQQGSTTTTQSARLTARRWPLPEADPAGRLCSSCQRSAASPDSSAIGAAERSGVCRGPPTDARYSSPDRSSAGGSSFAWPPSATGQPSRCQTRHVSPSRHRCRVGAAGRPTDSHSPPVRSTWAFN